MNFIFVCGWCGEDNVLFGVPRGFWKVTHYECDREFTCWSCAEVSTTWDATDDAPWTPAT